MGWGMQHAWALVTFRLLSEHAAACLPVLQPAQRSQALSDSVEAGDGALIIGPSDTRSPFPCTAAEPECCIVWSCCGNGPLAHPFRGQPGASCPAHLCAELRRRSQRQWQAGAAVVEAGGG